MNLGPIAAFFRKTRIKFTSKHHAVPVPATIQNVRPARVDALREFLGARQDGPGRRRWFESRDLELVVWYDERASLEGFQILYRRENTERALTWRPGRGFSHSRVDDGDDSPLKNLTPVLVPDGRIPWNEVESLFRQRAASLETDLRETVITQLQSRV